MSTTSIYSSRIRPNGGAFIAALPWTLALLAGQFLALGWIAHWIGTPLSLPNWLSGINRMFRYGFSSGLDLFIEAVWIVIIAALAVGVYFLQALPSVIWPNAASDQESPSDAFVRAFKACLPIAIVLWLVLAILPTQSRNLPQSPTGLDTLHALSWDDSLFELTEGIVVMLYIGALFVGIALGMMFFQRFLPKVRDGCGWQLIVSILFGIVLMLVIGIPSGPLLQQFQQAHGSKLAFLLVYGVTVALLLPIGVGIAGFTAEKKVLKER